MGRGSVKFEEVEDGKVRCGGCLKIFSRIVAHLKNNADCRAHIDMEELNLAWTRYWKRRRNKKCEQKLKKDNQEMYLQEKAKRRRKSEEKLKAENQEKFLQEKAKRRRKSEEK